LKKRKKISQDKTLFTLHKDTMSRKKHQQSKKGRLNTQNLIIAGVIIILGAFFFFQNKSSDVPLPTWPSTATLTISQNNQELGDIPMSKGKVEITYTLQNTGTEPVVLWNATTSCMCTQAYLVINQKGKKSEQITMNAPRDMKQVVKPWENMTLIAIFDPNAHGPDATWPITRSVYIETNSTSAPKLSFTFMGNVTK